MDKRLKASRDQEERVASLTGGNVQPGSGSGYMRKGDVRTARYLIECKMTEKDAYRLERKVLDKIEREALMEGSDFALFLSLGGRNYVVVDEDCFLTYNEPPDGP